MVGELNAAARTLALGGLRQRYPEATDRELRRRLADLLLGPDLAARLGVHALLKWALTAAGANEGA